RPEFVHKAIRQPSLLFLDELTNCSLAIQGAALELLTHGIMDDKGNRVDCWICAAANPPHCAADGNPLSLPTINRLYFHKWEYNVEKWSEAVMLRFPQVSYPILPKDWYCDKNWSMAASVVTGFLHKF